MNMRPTVIKEIQVSEHDKDQIREFLLFQKEISKVVNQLAPDNTRDVAEPESGTGGS